MRVPHLRPELMDDAQRSLYDQIVHGDRARHGTLVPIVDDRGRLLGPFNALLLHPPLGAAVQELGRALRYGGVLPARSREIVVLTVAVRELSSYEWQAHAQLGAAVGLDERELDALAAGRIDVFERSDERAALDLAVALLAGDRVDDALFLRATRELTPAGILEVSVLVGYYRLLATQLRLFDVPAPPAPWDP